MGLTYEGKRRFLANPNDRRHGTPYGYTCGCRCNGCREAGLAKAKERRERQYQRQIEKIREARVKEKAKVVKPKKAPKDCCTVPDYLLHLMGKPSVKNADGRCVWCGAPANNHHHVVRRSAGKVVVNGREIAKPTVLLCGDGNASGCHGKAHQHLLHFDFIEPQRNPKSCLSTVFYGAGCWVGQEFDEPIGQFEAMKVREGWRRL